MKLYTLYWFDDSEEIWKTCLSYAGCSQGKVPLSFLSRESAEKELIAWTKQSSEQFQVIETQLEATV